MEQINPTEIQILITEQPIKSPYTTMKNQNPDLEVWLTSRQVCDRYKISKSHLHDLRNEKKIPFTRKFDIILYPQSQIENLLLDSIVNVKNKGP